MLIKSKKRSELNDKITISNKPQISKKSELLAKNYKKKLGMEAEEIHSRLYEIKSPKKKQSKYRKKVLPMDSSPISDDSNGKNEEESVFFTERKNKENIEQRKNFSPYITNRAKRIVRKEKIDDFLYNDASKRLENKMSNFNNSEISVLSNKFLSKNSNEKANQKFFREFTQRLDEIKPNKKKYFKIF